MTFRSGFGWVAAALMTCVCLAQAPAKAPKKTPAKPKETFVQWLARVTGLSATSGSFRGGPDNGVAGDIWIGSLGQAGSQRLTFEGGWSWPVFAEGDKEIIAVRGGALWSIPVAGGDAVKMTHAPNGIGGLLGAGKDGLVVFTDDRIGLFRPDTGVFTRFEATGSEDEGDIARARRPREIDLNSDGEQGYEPSASHEGKRVVYLRSL